MGVRKKKERKEVTIKEKRETAPEKKIIRPASEVNRATSCSFISSAVVHTENNIQSSF